MDGYVSLSVVKRLISKHEGYCAFLANKSVLVRQYQSKRAIDPLNKKRMKRR